MNDLMKKILKAIKDNTFTYKDDLTDVKFKYVDELEIIRAVLTIFSDYNNKKMKEITDKLKKLNIPLTVSEERKAK